MSSSLSKIAILVKGKSFTAIHISATLEVGIATIALARGNFSDVSVPWALPFDFRVDFRE